MKSSRRVIITIEAETDAPLEDMRKASNWGDPVGESEYFFIVHQVTVNVIQRKGKEVSK